MPITLKKDVWKVKDPSSGQYRGAAILSTTLPQDAAQIISESNTTIQNIKDTAIDAVDTALNDESTGLIPKAEADRDAIDDSLNNASNGIIPTAQSDRDDIDDSLNNINDGIIPEAQANLATIAAAVQSQISQGTDKTLSVAKGFADAKAAGMMVKVSNYQPGSQLDDPATSQDASQNTGYPVYKDSNRVWVKETYAELEVPTMDDVDELKSALTGQSTDLASADDVDYYYVNATTGAQTYSGNFRRYLFKNVGYYSVTCTVYGDTPYAAIAFYNSDVPSADSFISAVPITERNQIATYSSTVPQNTKLIAVINRNASFESPTATLIINEARNAQFKLATVVPDVDQLKNEVVYDASITDAYLTENAYIRMSDGSRNVSSNFTAYYFKNFEYDRVSATVYISATQAAIAFFNNDNIKAENAYISGYQTGNKNTVTTFETVVPSNTKVIVISCRTSDYSTPSAILHMPNAVLKENIISNTEAIEYSKQTERIKDFSKACMVDVHQGYTKDGEITNTIGAFYDAYLKGATSFEADARKASDDVWMCCHDTTVTGIDEITGTTVTYVVSETPSTTLQRVILNANSKYGPQKVPTLKQVMNLAYKTGMILNLDMKDIRNNESQGPAIGTSLATLAHECGLSRKVIYAPNGGGINTVNAVLAIDPDAKFIDTPLRWQAAGISTIADYQNRIIGYIAYPDFSQEVLAVVRSLGCLLAISGIDTQSKFEEMIQYHPNLCEFIGSTDFRQILNNYFANLPG